MSIKQKNKANIAIANYQGLIGITVIMVPLSSAILVLYVEVSHHSGDCAGCFLISLHFLSRFDAGSKLLRPMQTLATLLGPTCCERLHSMLCVVACCCDLLEIVG